MMRQSQLKQLLCNHLQQILAHPQEPLSIPEPASLPWLWFVELSGSRSYHGAGPNPISFSEIEAYAKLMNLPLQPHHIDLIRALDETFIAHFSVKASSGNSGKNQIPPTPKHKATPAIHDAVFG